MARRNRDSHGEERSTEIAGPFERNDSENDAADNDSYAKAGSAQKRRTSSEDSSRPYNQEAKTSFLRRQGDIGDTETGFPGVKNNDQPRRVEERLRGKAYHPDTRANEDRVASKSLASRKRKRSKRTERRRLGDRRDRLDSESSPRRYSGVDGLTDKSQRKRKNASRADDEVPITEILKKAEENARAKYEEPVPLPELTTDTIYIQGKNGFSAVKIGGLRRALGNDTARGAAKDEAASGKERDFARTRTHTLIRVAITVQKIWKSTGLVFQGLLGGMALLHFVMLRVFFSTSMDFVSSYSVFSEVYTNVFSFLIALCVISVFDKFDLTRLDTDHLREIYTDHARSAIAVPLYLVTFGLHQASSRTDDRLAVARYCDINETIWSNSTTLETFLDELDGWQKVTLSKNLLAVFAWFFVALGTRDNMLLMHLESMEKYASDTQSSPR
ncbi:PREDICTED: uncharacterized protein LOC106741572 [Dinoponera quadriceps]|uniref:Uncharacterized protein LOC106741572 n=1 Tax=Dinoponera quadriceps TaxID=609295 RepID=A0A6P3WTN2_DINQU|nr:PREDICTED: uncharacterized protein LOC106741572 [Dinoponera quadriceps]